MVSHIKKGGTNGRKYPMCISIQSLPDWLPGFVTESDTKSNFCGFFVLWDLVDNLLQPILAAVMSTLPSTIGDNIGQCFQGPACTSKYRNVCFCK